ncbi:uncharacterized protein H6S33_011525 [Morchella sextelata]|uniref:uncharacterized protein n=1 Tax=Morchella sextelata TaxID=1174677 RepID=UPI001D042DA7|nr:uncharacterized protein H6S33_011525 [Morchella sextelata]KAH0611098.1 hypothetical protein H6S33_011525 [Morchella sextelata]
MDYQKINQATSPLGPGKGDSDRARIRTSTRLRTFTTPVVTNLILLLSHFTKPRQCITSRFFADSTSNKENDWTFHRKEFIGEEDDRKMLKNAIFFNEPRNPIVFCSGLGYNNLHEDAIEPSYQLSNSSPNSGLRGFQTPTYKAESPRAFGLFSASGLELRDFAFR